MNNNIQKETSFWQVILMFLGLQKKEDVSNKNILHNNVEMIEVPIEEHYHCANCGDDNTTIYKTVTIPLCECENYFPFIKKSLCKSCSKNVDVEVTDNRYKQKK